jgi:ubiquitin carboxyl-terminal hydrolase 1
VENCIAQYLAPELLSDVTCEMCSLRQTLAHYTIDAERLSSPSSSITTNTHTKSSASSPSTPETKSGSFSALENVRPNTNGLEENKGKAMTSSRKKRAKEAKRTEVRLQQMLESGTITHFGESYIPSLSKEKEIGSVVPVKWQIARTDSIREAAITRPPQSLRLHFIRSEYTPYGQLLKKSARVAFPLILDLTRFVANGVWEERNVLGMLGAGTDKNSNQTGTNTETNQEPQTKVLYRLESVILHYGYTHSSGHYICIRRKPRNGQINDISNRPEQVCKSCPDGCRCDACCWYGQVRPTESRGAQGEGEGEVRGKGWLRISDADVDEVGVEALIDARAAVFMVFYEKVGEYKGEGKGVVAERNEVEQERER